MLTEFKLTNIFICAELLTKKFNIKNINFKLEVEFFIDISTLKLKQRLDLQMQLITVLE